MNITELEKKVLIAIDCNEFGNELMDSVWVFAVKDYVSLENQFRGVASSLIKKGLIYVQNEDGENITGFTRLGARTYIDLVGKDKVNKYYELNDIQGGGVY